MSSPTKTKTIHRDPLANSETVFVCGIRNSAAQLDCKEDGFARTQLARQELNSFESSYKLKAELAAAKELE